MTTIAQVARRRSAAVSSLLKRLKTTCDADSIFSGTKSSTKGKAEYNFELGDRHNNTRIVGTDSISTCQTNPNFYRPDAGSYTMDLKFDTSEQKGRGNCYFMAALNSIKNTPNGYKTLQNNIKINSDGSVTVRLPGAIAIRKAYQKEGKKCEVTGIYTITPEALQKAANNAGSSYSKGDLDIIVYEIAMENYRAEMVKTQEMNITLFQDDHSAEKRVDHLGSEDYLSGGKPYDAVFILTGEKSDIYEASKSKMNNLTLYDDGKYGYITEDQLNQKTTAQRKVASDSTQTSKGFLPSISMSTEEVNSSTDSESEFHNMLDKYAGHEKEYALTVSVKVAKDGEDNSTKKGGGHALSVVKITKDTVYVSNPWHPDKIEPIPRKQFENMAYGFSAAPISLKPKVSKEEIIELLGKHKKENPAQTNNNSGSTDTKHGFGNALSNAVSWVGDKLSSWGNSFMQVVFG